MSAIAARVRVDAEPMCGTTVAPGARRSGWSGGSGSGSVTSSAAPPIWPAFVDQRVGVDHLAARGVDEHSVGLHQGELAGADQAAGLVGQRRVERDEVGSPEQLVERSLARVQHGHPEPLGAPADGLADAAPADHPERRVDVGAPAARRARTSSTPRAHRALAVADPPGARHEQRPGQVRGRLGQDVRGVAHRDAAPGRRVQVDVVGADRVVGDRPHRGPRPRAVRRRPDRSAASGARRPRPPSRAARPGAAARAQHLDLVGRAEARRRVAGQGARDEAAGRAPYRRGRGWRSAHRF